jgi:hypothetical protein
MQETTKGTFALAVVLALAACTTLPGSSDWETLIDGGRGMENFTNMGGANWRSEGDAIVADRRPGPEPTYYLATNKTYKDFQIHAEFWVSDDANSGLYLRCNDTRPMTDRTCHEANIYDKRPDPSYATGAIVWLVKAPVPVPHTGSQWNTMDVTAKGSHMEVVLNGQKTAVTEEARIVDGVIGLQYAGGVVKFRKLQIRRL